MEISEFKALLKPVTDLVTSGTIDAGLNDELKRRFPPGEDVFDSIENACHAAIAAGWMCANGDEKARWGRVIEPGEDTGGLSVDVVQLSNLVGRHHSHPTGEVCMIMPITPEAKFDGHTRGWCVFEAGSGHYPTVSDGQALILYMLPEGKIDFTEEK